MPSCRTQERAVIVWSPVVIAGYRAELARDRAGLGLTVFISLRVEQHSRETSRRIESALTAIPAVVACYVVSGQADFLVEAVVPSLTVYESLLLDRILAIPSITDTRSTFAIRTVLSRGPLPLEQLPGGSSGTRTTVHSR